MTSGLPRTRLEEFFLDISLTRSKHVVVEGNSDERFIRAWLDDVGLSHVATVTSVGKLHVDTAEVLALGLSDGNRSRVILVARRASEAGVDLRAIADRDCGHQVGDHAYPTLLWTDYPSLESYSLDATTLQRANLLSFEERLPDGDELVTQLTYPLRELFAVRARNEHVERPNYAGGLRAGGNRLASFDVAAAMNSRIRAEVPSYERPSSPDPRQFAYGHDIAELLFAAFANILRNQVGLKKVSAVEAALRSAVQAVGAFKGEPLFVLLLEWVRDGQGSPSAIT